MKTNNKKIFIVSLLICIAFILGMFTGIYYSIHYSNISQTDTQYIIEYNGYVFTHNK